MEYKQIQELIKAINKSNISELSVKQGDFEITIKQAQTVNETQFVAVQAPMPMAMPAAPQPAAISSAPAAPAAAPAAGDTAGTVVKSPMIGTFYRSSSPDKAPFVNVGDEVKAGQVLCIIEAMKLYNEIESEFSGRIVKVLADNSSPVEYDQPLFIIEPA